MGGYGSGRWGWSSKKTQVEDCHKWSIFTLKPCLILGFSGRTRWTRGEREIGSISFRVLGNERPNALRLIYTKGAKSGNPEEFDYQVNLTTTPLAWGGVRYWFLCPIVGCVRRVGCLYLPPGGKYFGCRHCYNLSYQSQQEGNSERSMFRRLSLEMQDIYPRANWKDVRDMFDGKTPRHLALLAAERYLAEWQDYDPYEGYLTAGELCEQSGLTVVNLKELKDSRLLNPDTRDGRYRPKLAGWGKKLAYLLGEGWEIEEIKGWSKERWKSENPRQWPPERVSKKG
ncbi:MAG: hypothetical protein ISR58_13860 [Anaerolineales bacterium]|nr:hypothetical protein [bacterium]MBL6982263.1 hypothetical protein [Anaerolineales bacterium]